MRIVLCLVSVSLFLVSSARAGETDAKARAIIVKAIDATGGEAKLAKATAIVIKVKGKFYGMGEGLDYTMERSIQPPDKTRFNLEVAVGDMKISIAKVFDGKKLWTKFNDIVQEVVDKEEMAEAREESHIHQATSLVPLVKEKGYTLALIGEAQVAGKPALGVRVGCKGRRDISLYFDKGTGLLVKSEHAVRDFAAGGKEFTHENFFSEFKEKDGLRQATKIAIHRDGKLFVDGEITEVERRERIEDAVFAKP